MKYLIYVYLLLLSQLCFAEENYIMENIRRIENSEEMQKFRIENQKFIDSLNLPEAQKRIVEEANKPLSHDITLPNNPTIPINQWGNDISQIIAQRISGFNTVLTEDNPQDLPEQYQERFSELRERYETQRAEVNQRKALALRQIELQAAQELEKARTDFEFEREQLFTEAQGAANQ